MPRKLTSKSLAPNAITTDHLGSEIDATLATKRSYFEQADEPLNAISGDVWRDTDTGVIATLFVDGTDRVWMEM